MASFFVLAATAVHNATAAITGAVTGAAPLDNGPASVSGAASVRGIVEGAVQAGAGTPAGAASAGAAAATAGEAASGLAGTAGNAATHMAANAASSPVVSTLGETSFSWGGYFQAIGVLFLLLAVLWGGVWLMRKYGKFNFMPKPGGFPRDSLRLEAQLPLGPRKGVMVVRFLNKRLLLGVTDHQITLLTESEVHHDCSNSAEFKDVLEAVQRQKTDA